MINSIAERKLIKHLPKPFININLLREAMCHRSYLNENQDMAKDNERLEFLGDAILGFVVAEWLQSGSRTRTSSKAHQNAQNRKPRWWMKSPSAALLE